MCYTEGSPQDFYFLAFPRDRRVTKSLVSGIYILELAQTVLLTHDAFGTYAVHYGDDSFLNNMQLIPLSVPIFSGLGLSFLFVSSAGANMCIAVSCAVQMHYGYLLRMLSGSRLLGLTVAFVSCSFCLWRRKRELIEYSQFSVIQCSAAFVQGVQAFIINDISALATKAFASETVR